MGSSGTYAGAQGETSPAYKYIATVNGRLQVLCIVFKNYCFGLVMSVMIHAHTVHGKFRDFLKVLS